MALLRRSWSEVRAEIATQLTPEQSDLPQHAEKECEPVQSIVHDEAPAVRDPDLLNLQADEEWASSVEMLLHGGYTIPESSEDNHAEEIWLLQFKSHPHEFKEALSDGIPLRACRDALAAENRPFILPESEAKIFIKPEQWEAVMSSLKGQELRPYHVIVTSSYEHLVTECLLSIPYRRRPKLKTPSGRKVLTSEEGLKTFGENTFSECDAEIGSFRVLRTFLCCAPLLRNPESVCQSTADHYRATTNPRRYQK